VASSSKGVEMQEWKTQHRVTVGKCGSGKRSIRRWVENVAQSSRGEWKTCHQVERGGKHGSGKCGMWHQVTSMETATRCHVHFFNVFSQLF